MAEENTDFAHLFYPTEQPDEQVDTAQEMLRKIDHQAHFAEAILAEMEGTGSPTILMLWEEAKTRYIDAVRALVDLNPFESAEEKAKFIRVQNDARRFMDMFGWLQQWAAKHKQAQEFNSDEIVQQIRAERERDDRPTD